MKVTKILWILCPGLLALLLAVPLAACGHRAGGKDARTRTLSSRLKLEQVAPFVKDVLPSIQGNLMHEKHFADGVHCGECHPTNQPMPVQEAHKVCQNCHAERKVAKHVWQNHCLSCHHFTKNAQQYETDAKQMVDNLCHKCHAATDPLGGSIYMLSGHQASEMVKCDHCHRPHESNAPAAAELCVTCHKEFKEVRHPGGSQAKCSICHGAHRKPPSGFELCTACHGQPKDVLVHKIKNHPKDCLKCHNAHLTGARIKGVCGDCHKGLVYRGEANQPDAHLDCKSCHILESFKFKGAQSCAGCHKKESAQRGDSRVPKEHKNCTTCHYPHSWRASFSRNCTRCHQTSSIPEHKLEFHSKLACNKCHNPHRPAEMPKTGECASCHKNVPSFGRNAPEMHLQCTNCHANPEKHEFTVSDWAATCKVCHAQARTEPAMEWSAVPSGHNDCSTCHERHSMRLAEVKDSCAICHSDVMDQAPNGMHEQCFNCHSQNHSVAFVGEEDSCKSCHGAPPGTHAAAGHADCLNCHTKHSFAVEAGVCTVCHSDKEEGHHPGQKCTECHTFKEQ